MTGGPSDVARSSPQKRVVCILCPGGLEHSGGIGRVMGYVIDAWAHDRDGPAAILVDTRGAGPIAFAPLQFARALTTIGGLALRGRLRILHINLSSHGSTVRKAVAMVLARALGLRSVIHLHGSRFDAFYRGLSPAGSRMVRWMFSRADRVVVLGRYWRDFAVSEVGVPAERVEIVFNGVPDPGRPALYDDRRRPDDTGVPHIVFLGRLGERKGVPELISALEMLAGEGRPWRATLAGDGPVDAYRARVRAAGLDSRIALPGWVDRTRVDELLGEADIVVLPSHQENQPMSVIEAMAHRIAVVTTLVGALPDILCDDVNALIVEPGSVESLAHGLRRLIDDPDLRSRIAHQGRNTFSEKLDIRIAAAHLARIYREIDRTPSDG
jgi:glycosyltransferase involved in cell wall biosynthesis